MATRIVKAVLSRMKMIDEAADIVVTNDGQGLITIDEFSLLEWEICRGYLPVYMKTWRDCMGGVSNPGF